MISLQNELPNPFLEGDVDRDRLEWALERIDDLESKVRLLMGTVHMLAEAEAFRMKKFVDKA